MTDNSPPAGAPPHGLGRQTGLPIEIEGVTKTYGAVTALADIELRIDGGEFVTLLGPSGSGKTTLLMILAGFVRPDCGHIRFGARDVVRAAPHQRDVGMVFQNYALFPHMSVAENIAYPLKMRRIDRGEIKERVARALALVRLPDFGDRRIDQLSGGQRQRIALARAVVYEPRILLMDEPLSALDKKLRDAMQIEIRHLHDSLGMTTVYVTHDQREALTMSDRISVIDQGRIVQTDTPRRLYDEPATRFVADFIGESMFLPVELANGTATIRGRPLRSTRPLPATTGRALLLVRPEKIDLLPDGSESGDYNIFEGTVRSIIFQGDSLMAFLDVGAEQDIVVRTQANHSSLDTMPAEGQRVCVGIHVEDTVILASEDAPQGPAAQDRRDD